MIKAVYSSNVFANEDHVFETMTIQLEDKSGSIDLLPAILLSRRAERQCFQYTDYEDAESKYDNEYILNADDWEVLDLQTYDHIGGKALIEKVNGVTTSLVQKHDVRDVNGRADWVSLYRQEFLTPFKEKKDYGDILTHKDMERFERDVKISMVNETSNQILSHFRKHFSLPKKTSIFETLPEFEIEKPRYETWGDYA